MHGTQYVSSDACTIFIGDLSIFCSKEKIHSAFAEFGEIVDIRLKKDEKTSKMLSYGFVEYSTPNAAIAAMQEMNGKILCGRKIRIGWASNKGNDFPGLDKGPPELAFSGTSSIHVSFMSFNVSHSHYSVFVIDNFLSYPSSLTMNSFQHFSASMGK